MTKKISIGMPVFNGEEYLDVAIRSIRSQTFSDFELLILDNASTDRTAELCKAHCLSDPRITYKKNDENIGATRNFIKVFEESDGEYFMWAAADDIWSEDWLSRLVSCQDEEVGISFGRVISIDHVGVVQDHCANNRDLSFSNGVLVRRLRFANYPPINGKANLIYSLWRRDVLEAVLATYRLKDEPAADMFFCFEALRFSKIVSVPNTFLFKRTQSSSSVRSLKPSFLDKVRSISNLDIYLGLLNRCSIIERIFMILLAPFFLLVSSYFSLSNRRKF